MSLHREERRRAAAVPPRELATSGRSAAVDAYLARFPRETRALLQRVRATIRRALPRAQETIAYGVPLFKLHGTYAVYFAGFKEHYSLYPATGRLVAAVKAAAPYRVSKGTLRFSLADPVRVTLIERIARFLGREAAERARSSELRRKRPRPKARPEPARRRRPRTVG